MLELLFLLLPIAAAYGWYMGRRSARIYQQHHHEQKSQNYFEGLNFLLSDQPDKAVDRFIELLQVDSDTFDTHLSLGNLFRKRGEVDRSIRIHQNLIVRPRLSLKQKDIAMMELAKDYLAAGLFDRAEEILLQMLKDPDHSSEAEQQLLSVYQATKEWWKAIHLVKRFKRHSRKQLAPQVAHFYCQLAEESPDNADKVRFWQLAIAQDPSCGRAYLAQFTFAMANQNELDAMAVAESLARKAPLWFTELLPRVTELYLKHNNVTAYQAMLTGLLQQHPSAVMTLALAETLTPNEAEQLILKHLHKHPTMVGFHRLMQLHANAATSESSRSSLILLSDLVEQQIRLRPKYRCRQCGFPGHSLYWQCPSCKSWGQTQRFHGLDGD
ncbi:MAG: lipopolysaccharide assembly protein LapB [Ferrimonas sp.]